MFFRLSGISWSVWTARRGWAYTLRCLFWTALIAIHGGALVASLRIPADPAQAIDFGSGIRILALAATTLFCLLKLTDVRWLRLNSGWRSRLAAALIVAVLHVGAITRTASAESSFTPVHYGAAVAVITAANCGALARWLRRLRQHADSHAPSYAKPRLREASSGPAWTSPFLPLIRFLCAGPVGLRAPPHA